MAIQTLSGTAEGAGIPAAVIVATFTMPGATSGGATIADVNIKLRMALRGSSVGTSTAVSAALRVTRTVTATTAGVTVMGAILTSRTVIRGPPIVGQATAQGNILITRTFAGNANGTSSTIQANLITFIWILGQAAGVAAVSCAIIEIPYRQRGCLWPGRTLKGSIRLVKRPL